MLSSRERLLGGEKPESERPVLDQRDQPAPSEPRARSASLPPPFIVVRKGGAHERGHGSRCYPINRGGTVVEYCRKYTVGRQRALLSSWISFLVLWRLQRPSCSVRVIVMARVGPGPHGRSAGVHTRRSGGHMTSPDPPSRWEAGPEGRREQYRACLVPRRRSQGAATASKMAEW